MNLPNNTTLQQGKYRISRFLSSGGFGCTYEAINVYTNQRVAIKELFVKDVSDRNEQTLTINAYSTNKSALLAKIKRKFIEEANALMSMNHPNIVKVYDSFEENGTAYYVMDYIDGQSLLELVNRIGALPEKQALKYINQIADALSYVHSLNRLHLDIKPGNIMIDRNDNAILIDFGVSKQYDEANGENTSTVIGKSPEYSPIEQLGNNIQQFSPATDIYALGATLYKCVTGKTPPHATTILSDGFPQIYAPVSENVKNAIKMAMETVKKNRVQDIAEFKKYLNGVINNSERKPVPLKDEKKSSRNSVLWIGMIIIGILVVIFAQNFHTDFFTSASSAKLELQQKATSPVKSRSITFNYVTYDNDRFQYSVKYPNNLKRGVSGMTGDGANFRSEDGSAKFSVAGYWNCSDMYDGSISDEYNDAIANYGELGANVTYKILKNKYFVISGTKGSKIFYRVTKWRGSIGVTAEIEFNESDKSAYKPACEEIYKSLTLRIDSY